VTRSGHQLIEHTRVGRRPVGGHLTGARAELQGAAKEPASGRQIPLLRDQDIDNLPERHSCVIRVRAWLDRVEP
jgi:hypothetical protein